MTYFGSGTSRSAARFQEVGSQRSLSSSPNREVASPGWPRGPGRHLPGSLSSSGGRCGEAAGTHFSSWLVAVTTSGDTLCVCSGPSHAGAAVRGRPTAAPALSSAWASPPGRVSQGGLPPHFPCWGGAPAGGRGRLLLCSAAPLGPQSCSQPGAVDLPSGALCEGPPGSPGTQRPAPRRCPPSLLTAGPRAETAA